MLLCGGYGILYRRGMLPDMALDVALATSICPNADDEWFWAMATLAGTDRVCIATPKPTKCRRQCRTRSLAQARAANESTPFERAVEHFNLQAVVEAQVAESITIKPPAP